MTVFRAMPLTYHIFLLALYTQDHPTKDRFTSLILVTLVVLWKPRGNCNDDCESVYQ
jgi:hypothetical protein